MKIFKAKILTMLVLSMMLLATNAFPQDGQRIKFKSGKSSAVVKGTVAQGGPDFWLVKAKQGQTLTVRVRGKVTFGMDSPRGQMTEDDGEDTSYSFDLDFDGDYTIRVYSGGGVQDYTLSVSIL